MSKRVVYTDINGKDHEVDLSKLVHAPTTLWNHACTAKIKQWADMWDELHAIVCAIVGGSINTYVDHNDE